MSLLWVRVTEPVESTVFLVGDLRHHFGRTLTADRLFQDRPCDIRTSRVYAVPAGQELFEFFEHGIHHVCRNRLHFRYRLCNSLCFVLGEVAYDLSCGLLTESDQKYRDFLVHAQVVNTLVHIQRIRWSIRLCNRRTTRNGPYGRYPGTRSRLRGSKCPHRSCSP